MMSVEAKGKRIRTIPPIAVQDWCWFAEIEDDGNTLRIEKAKKVPDESIRHLLDLTEGCELLSDEYAVDHWFLEQKARFRRWRLTSEARRTIVDRLAARESTGSPKARAAEVVK